MISHYRYQWKIGSWSECSIVSSSSDEGVTPGQCGGGLMTRNLTCYDVTRARPAHPNLCFELGDRRTEINLVKRFVPLLYSRDRRTESQFCDKSALIFSEHSHCDCETRGEKNKSITIR